MAIVALLAFGAGGVGSGGAAQEAREELATVTGERDDALVDAEAEADGARKAQQALASLEDEVESLVELEAELQRAQAEIERLRGEAGEVQERAEALDRRQSGLDARESALEARQEELTAAETSVRALVGAADAPSVYYENCDAARDAGDTPLRRGEAGYASHLDGDNDGIACE